MSIPIFVINLADSQIRWQNTQARFAEYGLDVQRLNAVYGAHLNDTEIDALYSSSLNRHQYHRPLSLGEIGCFASHRKAWQAVIDSGNPFGIVVEDDISVSAHLPSVIEALRTLSFDWDLIKLAPYQNRSRPIVFRHFIAKALELVIHKKPLTGCAGYAISQSGAAKLLASTQPFGRPVDSQLQHTWEHNIDIYALLPFAIHQDMAYDSDIGTTRKQHSQSHRLRRLSQQIYAYWKNRQATNKSIERLKQKLRP